TSYTDLGATALDACDGALAATPSGAVNANSPGTYTVTYTATDAAGNPGTASRTVNVVDTQGPTVTLTGANPQIVECHTTYTDLGATALDACDGALTATPSGAVNANSPGTYTVTYTATDAAGHPGTASRTVNVVDTQSPTVTPPGPVTVYTGPGALTCSKVVSNYALGNASASDLCDATLPITRTGV